jgi:hypothetical protein
MKEGKGGKAAKLNKRNIKPIEKYKLNKFKDIFNEYKLLNKYSSINIVIK